MPVERSAVELPVGLVPGLALVVAVRVALLDALTCEGASGLHVGLARAQLAIVGLRCRRGPASAPSSSSKNAPDLAPDLLAAAEPAPARADQRRRGVALVDRHEPLPARAARAVDEQRLDVGLHAREHRVARLELVPGRAARAATPSRPSGSGSRRPPGPPARAVEEERHVDRDPQLAPRRVVQREAVEPQPAVGHQPECPPPAAPRSNRSEQARQAHSSSRASRSSRWRCSGAIGAPHISQRSSAASRSRRRAPRQAPQPRARRRRGHAVTQPAAAEGDLDQCRPRRRAAARARGAASGVQRRAPRGARRSAVAAAGAARAAVPRQDAVLERRLAGRARRPVGVVRAAEPHEQHRLAGDRP